jgi:hypothetical protein
MFQETGANKQRNGSHFLLFRTLVWDQEKQSTWVWQQERLAHRDWA